LWVLVLHFNPLYVPVEIEIYLQSPLVICGTRTVPGVSNSHMSSLSLVLNSIGKKKERKQLRFAPRTVYIIMAGSNGHGVCKCDTDHG